MPRMTPRDPMTMNGAGAALACGRHPARPAAGAALAALLLLVSGCSGDGSPGDRDPLADFTLVFEGRASGQPAIFRIRLDDRSEPERLLAGEPAAGDPAPSPDGQRLAFVATDELLDTDLVAARLDGSSRIVLADDTEPEEMPEWSPDGAWIVFRSFAGEGLGNIHRVRPDGAGEVNLTPDPRPGITEERRPAWSPDGSRIVFASNRSGDMDLWIMAADGADPVPLTFGTPYDTEPTWSPDGGWIAFRRDDTMGSDIMIVAAGGGEPRRLPLEGLERMPAWSPDGEWIAFVTQPGLADQPEIEVMRPDGSDRRRITRDPSWGGGLNPAFMPGAR